MTISDLQDKLDRIIRVDHAGEYGARRIYEGQMRALKNKSCYDKIKEMHEQEQEHLQYFEDAIINCRARPTALLPLWHVGGYAMGLITGLMGEKAAMACTVAVEEVIGDHYAKQYNDLSEDIDLYKKNKELAELQKKISKFRDDELEHRDIGLDHAAEDALGYPVIRKAVKFITKTAIKLSERL